MDRVLSQKERAIRMFRLRLAILFSGLACGVSFAGSWSGALVDADCYAARQRNVNHREPSASHDVKGAIRYCSPKPQTKGFAIVQHDGSTLQLDSSGNSKAAELVQKTGKQSTYKVQIVGDVDQNIVKVESISISK
jgi:hypothetical protein